MRMLARTATESGSETSLGAAGMSARATEKPDRLSSLDLWRALLACRVHTHVEVTRTLLIVSFAFLCTGLFAQDQTTTVAQRGEKGALAILPGGRRITPLGSEFETGPGTFGLAVSPGGSRIATSDGGSDYFSITLLRREGSVWNKRELRLKKREKGKAQNESAWESVFMGLAFASETELWASEGESGCVRLFDTDTSKTLARVCLNDAQWKDSYTGDLALDRNRGLLYVVDQANYRAAIIDAKQKKLIGGIKVGRLPFAVALSPDARRLYVTNIGMFEYKPVPGASIANARETGLPFPPFGFPSREAEEGVERETAAGKVKVPGLGPPNTRLSNSVAVVNVENPRDPKLERYVRTGLPFGGPVEGGSSPAGVLATSDRVYVTNAHNDSLTVLDAKSDATIATIELRIPGYENLRGVMPLGLRITADGKWLLAAEAGINALAVIDTMSNRVLGHIPMGWFPTRVVESQGELLVVNAKGRGTGPNATEQAALPHSFQADRRRGSLLRFPLPAAQQLPGLTARVLENNRFTPSQEAWRDMPDIRHAVLIVKENRTYDEVFGDLPWAARSAPALARLGRRVTPNHHELATQFAISNNFYADSEVSVDGHHWLVGSYPDEWTESTKMASYGDEKNFRFPTSAPGRFLFAGGSSSLHPEEQLEAGSLWHLFARNHILFRNYGEGFELTGVQEAAGEKPTGARFLTNIPMPEPLYENTARDYPGFNLNIPDQFRANQFIADAEKRFANGKTAFPQFIFIHLPDDHMMDARPKDGYPTEISYVVDNDYALGRMVEYLTHTPWWKNMAIFVTEDDSQGGVDHVDSHRTVLMVVSPYAKKQYVSQVNTSFPGMLRTIFKLLHLPALNLYDASSPDLRDCFTNTPDFRAYKLRPVDASIFDPTKAKDPLDPRPGPIMDDPRLLRKQHAEPERK
jgi:YVTN family beta-propeller protein